MGKGNFEASYLQFIATLPRVLFGLIFPIHFYICALYLLWIYSLIFPTLGVCKWRIVEWQMY